MRITVSGRHKDVSDRLQTYASEKAGKLERYYDRVQSVEVIFSVDGGKHQCEVLATAGHHTVFVAKEENEDPYAALDATVKDLERQIRRHKEKFRNRKHPAGRSDREPLGGPSSEHDSGDMETEGEAS